MLLEYRDENENLLSKAGWRFIEMEEFEAAYQFVLQLEYINVKLRQYWYSNQVRSISLFFEN